MKAVTQQEITKRADSLLSALLLLTHCSAKTMPTESFKEHIKMIPNSQRIMACLKENKIIGVSRKGMSSFATYSNEVRPNIEMCKKILLCSQRMNREARGPKRVEKRLPITLCEKKELAFDKKEDLQSQLIAELNRVKKAFEDQCDAKVEILVEITSTTTIQL